MTLRHDVIISTDYQNNPLVINIILIGHKQLLNRKQMQVQNVIAMVTFTQNIYCLYVIPIKNQN